MDDARIEIDLEIGQKVFGAGELLEVEVEFIVGHGRLLRCDVGGMIESRLERNAAFEAEPAPFMPCSLPRQSGHVARSAVGYA
jgi:hypothetical protein